jgi:hypothetical protein
MGELDARCSLLQHLLMIASAPFLAVAYQSGGKADVPLSRLPLRGMPSYAWVREEANECRQDFVSYELIHFDRVLEANVDPSLRIYKPQFCPDSVWVEPHMVFGESRKAHYYAVADLFSGDYKIPPVVISGNAPLPRWLYREGWYVPMLLEITDRRESPSVRFAVSIVNR